MPRYARPSRIVLCSAIAFVALGAVEYLGVGHISPGIWMAAFAAAALPLLLLFVWESRSQLRRKAGLGEVPEPEWMLDSAHPMIFATTLRACASD